MPTHNNLYDVAVIGAGIGGLAASIFLRQAGLRVVCIETKTYPHHKVGESLDWSSPGLLRRAGLSGDTLIADHVATYKKNIAVSQLGKDEWKVAPPPIIRRSPLRFETVTLHVDRAALDQRLCDQALALGTSFIWDRVAHVETEGDRVNGCVTASGQRVEARWYIDASGTARALARAMGISKIDYGRSKVCLWTYFDTEPLDYGTTFFVDNSDEYLSWIWDIPISPTQTSIGYVLPAETMQARKREGGTNNTILGRELIRHERFHGLLAAQPAFEVHSTSFRPYVTTHVCGPNWFMVGESASMPDPLTGNGVTSAIRHARYAVEAIREAGAGDEISEARRRSYSRHVLRLGRSFNAHIENAIYRHPIRWGFGIPAATVIYTFFAFFMNAFYARFDPQSRVAMAIFDGLFLGARAWIAGWTQVARVAMWMRGSGYPRRSG